MEPRVSGVGVLDKALMVLRCLEQAPHTLAEVVETTGLSRATAHRLLSALAVHRLTRRDPTGRFALGPGAYALGRAAARSWPLGEIARPCLASLRDATGESVQLFIPDGDRRVCVAAFESPHGLRTIVAEGATLPVGLGSGGRALLVDPVSARWVASVGEREPGVASVSAPVIDNGAVVAAVSVSGPIDRLGRDPGSRFGDQVMVTAAEIAALSGFDST